MIDANRRPSGAEIFRLTNDILSHDSIMARCVMGDSYSTLSDEELFDECREETILLIQWMENLMTLAGAFLYAKFNQWRTGKGANPDDKEQPNALYLKRLLAGIQNTDVYFDRPSTGLRVLRVLDGLYDSFDMNFYVIKYLIINAQIEAGFNNAEGELRGLALLLGFPHEKSLRFSCNPDNKKFKIIGKNLAAAFNFISHYRNDINLKISFDLYPHREVEEAFYDVLLIMEFMKRISLRPNSGGDVDFVEVLQDGTERSIPSYGVVKLFAVKNGRCKGEFKGGELTEDINFYLLEGMEYFSDSAAVNAAVRFSYRSFDERDSALVYFAESPGLVPEECAFSITPKESAASCYKDIGGYLPGTRSVSSFFRGMLTAHYRYHNVLAPSLVDAIDGDRDAKKRILKGFVESNEASFKEALEPSFKTLEFALGITFPEAWKGKDGKKGKIDLLCDFINADEYKSCRIIDWDTLMARILIYEGPSEIVKAAILQNKASYELKDKEQIEKICDQIIAGLEMRYIDKIFDAVTVSKSQKENYNVFKPSVENFKNLFPGEYAIKMECKALAQSYIDTIVKTLTKIDKKDSGPANNRFAENSIQDTLAILAAFRNEKRSPGAEKAFVRTVSAFLAFYEGIFRCCNQRMSYEFEKSSVIFSPKDAEERQKKIEDDFFLGVSHKAAELAAYCRSENAVELALKALWKFANMPPDDVRYYNAVLARPPVNPDKLSKIFSVDGNGNVIFFRVEGDALDFAQAAESRLLIRFLERVTAFLSGEDPDGVPDDIERDKSNYTGYKEHAKRVVYPQIVTFAKHREDCDANDCLIMDHSGAFSGWHNGEVQILTEFKYTINHAYYAMPNLNRIETEWWVDPLLISCYRFDEEMRKAEPPRLKETL